MKLTNLIKGLLWIFRSMNHCGRISNLSLVVGIGGVPLMEIDTHSALISSSSGKVAGLTSLKFDKGGLEFTSQRRNLMRWLSLVSSIPILMASCYASMDDTPDKLKIHTFIGGIEAGFFLLFWLIVLVQLTPEATQLMQSCYETLPAGLAFTPNFHNEKMYNAKATRLTLDRTNAQNV